MPFKPLQDRIVVRRVAQEDRTKGGIIIPDTAKEKPMEGEVLAVGPGLRADDGTLTPPELRRGDIVLFGQFAGNEVRIDGEELLVMRESDVLGVIAGKARGKKAA